MANRALFHAVLAIADLIDGRRSLGGHSVFARNTRFGREFSYILRLCLTPKSTVKVLLLITAMITLLLTEVRLNVLSTFMSKGLYDSMQDLNASAFWMFAAMNAGVVLIRAFNTSSTTFSIKAWRLNGRSGSMKF